jgi:hypothetical protein
MPEAAKVLGLGQKRIYQLGLPTRRAGNGALLVRWFDLAHVALDRQRRGRRVMITTCRRF